MIERMDNVGIVVDDLTPAIGFFVELGLELEGEATVQLDRQQQSPWDLENPPAAVGPADSSAATG